MVDTARELQAVSPANRVVAANGEKSSVKLGRVRIRVTPSSCRRGDAGTVYLIGFRPGLRGFSD
jgi:hypothetical protein